MESEVVKIEDTDHATPAEVFAHLAEQNREAAEMVEAGDQEGHPEFMLGAAAAYADAANYLDPDLPHDD